MKRLVVALLALGLAAVRADAQTISKTVGQATLSADLTQAFPGGLIVARVHSRGHLGTTYAILDGRRSLVYDTPHGGRALVPIAADTEAGANVLGFEIWTRRGRQRIPLDIQIAARDYPSRSVTIPEARRPLLKQPGAVVDARQMLVLLRTESPLALWQGPFRPPVGAPPLASFGSQQTWVGGSPVDSLLDGIYGARHRGLDYETGTGTIVQAPAAGSVLFAGNRTLTGGTLVLDHGQGVVSLIAHLARVDVRGGELIEGRTPIGLAGDTGIAYAPHVHWGLYVHGVAVDPRIFEVLPD
jgi:murein DD-endopeptidase MepM/ murein hydrolase activator NlpD